MSQRYLPCEREQQYLMPASLSDWLPEDHFAWFVLEAVEQLDLSAFHAAYRDDGWGRQAYDPQAVATSEQVIVAAELTRAATDVQELQPMVETANRIDRCGGSGQPIRSCCWRTQALLRPCQRSGRWPGNGPRVGSPARKVRTGALLRIANVVVASRPDSRPASGCAAR